MERFLLICLAGAVGTGSRYLIGSWAAPRFGTAFPAGTLIVNVLGCFLMGLVAQLAISMPNMSPNLRIALTTGFLGGLTTYSSFNYETTKLMQSGSGRMALLNFGVTVTSCVVSGLLGVWLARRFAGA